VKSKLARFEQSRINKVDFLTYKYLNTSCVLSHSPFTKIKRSRLETAHGEPYRDTYIMNRSMTIQMSRVPQPLNF